MPSHTAEERERARVRQTEVGKRGPLAGAARVGEMLHSIVASGIGIFSGSQAAKDKAALAKKKKKPSDQGMFNPDGTRRR